MRQLSARRLNPLKIIGWTIGIALMSFVIGGKASYACGGAVFGLIVGIVEEHRKAKEHIVE
jgi:hypothetical protein